MNDEAFERVVVSFSLDGKTHTVVMPRYVAEDILATVRFHEE